MRSPRQLLKEAAEYYYWRGRRRIEGELSGPHYRPMFTELFGLDMRDYEGKQILDVGCGPRGSLEWADMAAERVGLDPLADSYRRLGTDRHAMSYVKAEAEDMPFDNGHFHVVSAFNALDHVEHLARAEAEIGRVCAPGGLFLLLVEIDHGPTWTEPQTMSSDVLERLAPAFEAERVRRFEIGPGGINGSALAGVAYDEADPRPRPSVLVVRFRRRG